MKDLRIYIYVLLIIVEEYEMKYRISFIFLFKNVLNILLNKVTDYSNILKLFAFKLSFVLYKFIIA